MLSTYDTERLSVIVIGMTVEGVGDQFDEVVGVGFGGVWNFTEQSKLALPLRPRDRNRKRRGNFDFYWTGVRFPVEADSCQPRGLYYRLSDPGGFRSVVVPGSSRSGTTFWSWCPGNGQREDFSHGD